MKLNSTVVLTFVLLSLMFGAGLMSAAWGLVMGREALKGVTQPDTRPANNLANRQSNGVHSGSFAILREDEILATVKSRMGDRKTSAAPAAVAKPVVARSTRSGDPAQFPIVGQSQGVTLEVSSVRPEGDSIVLKINLRNAGKQPVRFLYSFLSIKDERGRELNASTEGLPGELPAASETFSGTVNIPTAILDKVEKLSLSLTDYPDQRLQIQLADIPIVR